MAADVQLEVGDRTVRISNPDRVYFPARGETKLDLVRYYLSGGDALDRQIADSGLRGNPSDMYAPASLPELLLRKESKRTRRYFASGGKDVVPDGLPGHHSPFISALLVTLDQIGRAHV